MVKSEFKDQDIFRIILYGKESMVYMHGLRSAHNPDCFFLKLHKLLALSVRKTWERQ